jgi:vacuolar-type H+-ATPase subunit E/Vma4
MKAKSLIITFLFIFLTVNPSKCWDWDPLSLGPNIEKLKGMMNEAIDKILSGMGELINKAKDAINQVMDKLFDEKLKALLQNIQDMIDKNLKQINSYIQQIINQVFDKINELVDHMTNRVKELINETVDQIKNKIIDEFFDNAQKLVDSINKDIGNLLNRIDDSMYKVYCSERTAANQIISIFTANLPFYNPIADICRQKLNEQYPGHNLKWKFFSRYSQNELYQYKKCRLMIDVTEKSPIKSVVLAYSDVELLAGDMRCQSVALRAESMITYYSNEMAECVAAINLYNKFEDETKIPIEMRRKFLSKIKALK